MNHSIVSFTNPGVIDIRCITTQGASVKEGENAIGYFGTGLKYAVAVILRGGGKLTIWRGMDPVEFYTAPVQIRGKSFPIVMMREGGVGRELGFTTDLGKNWKMWMAFREIMCNTIDEDGEMTIGRAVPPSEGQTTIVVECGDFANEARAKKDYILDGDPIYAHPAAALFGHASSSIFYRGVRVKEKTYKPFMFTPNIFEQMDLTEDRTLANDWQYESAIQVAITACQDKRLLKRWLSVGEEYREHSIGLSTWGTRGTMLLEVARSIYHDPHGYKNLNSSMKRILKDEDGEPTFSISKLLPVEKAQLKESVDFCKDLGYEVDEYPIIVCDTLGENILGLANTEAKKIFLARTAIAQGKLNLAGTLIEEWAHIKHKHEDCSRGFQNWLLQEMVKHGASYVMERDGK